MERETFLARVRDATARAVLPEHPTDPGLLVPDLEDVDLVRRFVERLEEVEGVVHEVDTSDAARREVVGIVRRHGARSFLSWDETHLPVGGIGTALRAEGLDEVSGAVASDDRLAHQMGYLDLDVGITGAEAGLAESGSIVLRSGPGRPRMASAIPLIHIAVLRRDRLYRSLAHWTAAEGSTVAAASNLVVVTGPSRTADIEQHINVGVHGPRYVHVVLL